MEHQNEATEEFSKFIAKRTLKGIDEMKGWVNTMGNCLNSKQRTKGNKGTSCLHECRKTLQDAYASEDDQ